MRRTLLTAALAATALGAVPSGASAATAVGPCVTTPDDPITYSYVTVCARTNQQGTTVAPYVALGCGVLRRRYICESALLPVTVGTTGVDDDGMIWVDGTRFIGP